MLAGWASGEDEIGRRFAAVAATFQIEADRLAVSHAVQTSALDGGDVQEHILGAAFGLDKTETFGGVEPFHCAIGHSDIPCDAVAHKTRRPGKAEDRELSRQEQVRKRVLLNRDGVAASRL